MNNIEMQAMKNKKSQKKQTSDKKIIDNLKLTKWNTTRDLDVIITSSSRPELLKLTLQYFETNIHFHGNIRFILNEDFVIKKESEKLVKWAKNSGYFKQEDIYCHQKPLGLDNVIIKLIDKVKTPYYIYLQDDWILERPLEIDKVMYIMDKIPNINNILFYKYKVPHMINKIKLKEYYFKQFPQYLTMYFSWEFIPHIARTSFVKPIIKEAMKDRKRRTAPAKLTHYLRDPSKREDYDFLYNNVGVFMWGGYNEPRWFRHIGEDARMENWRMTADGKPGKENTYQEKNVIQMAPWIPFKHIPEIPKRNSIQLIKEHLFRTNRTIQ